MEVVTLYPVVGLNWAQFHTSSDLQCKINLESNVVNVSILNYWASEQNEVTLCVQVL